MENTVQNIPVSQIVPGNNDRTQFDQQSIRGLADSIAEIGLAQPITVRPHRGKHQIVAGERRYRACRLLGWDTIPALVREMTDEAADAIMLAENLNRRDLDPIDEAEAIQKRMNRYGWTVAEAADSIHISEGRVRNRLALLNLIPDIQHLVRYGNFPIGHAALMKDLGQFYQLAALKTYQSTPKPPTQKQFAVVVGELEAKQAQAAMFDMDALLAPQAEIVNKINLPKAYRLQFTLGTIKLDLRIEVKSLSLPYFRSPRPAWAQFAGR